MQENQIESVAWVTNAKKNVNRSTRASETYGAIMSFLKMFSYKDPLVSHVSVNVLTFLDSDHIACYIFFFHTSFPSYQEFYPSTELNTLKAEHLDISETCLREKMINNFMHLTQKH